MKKIDKHSIITLSTLLLTISSLFGVLIFTSESIHSNILENQNIFLSSENNINGDVYDINDSPTEGQLILGAFTTDDNVTIAFNHEHYNKNSIMVVGYASHSEDISAIPPPLVSDGNLEITENPESDWAYIPGPLEQDQDLMVMDYTYDRFGSVTTAFEHQKPPLLPDQTYSDWRVDVQYSDMFLGIVTFPPFTMKPSGWEEGDGLEIMDITNIAISSTINSATIYWDFTWNNDLYLEDVQVTLVHADEGEEIQHKEYITTTSPNSEQLTITGLTEGETFSGYELYVHSYETLYDASFPLPTFTVGGETIGTPPVIETPAPPVIETPYENSGMSTGTIIGIILALLVVIGASAYGVWAWIQYKDGKSIVPFAKGETSIETDEEDYHTEILDDDDEIIDEIIDIED